MLLSSLLRKIGVGIFVFTLTGGIALAEDGPDSTQGSWVLTEQIGTGTQHYDPPYGGGYSSPPSFGGCNSAGTFCWNITLPPTPQPPYHYYPIEVYGDQAKNIVERGHIIDRRFDWNGWRYLVKTGWQSWFQFKNKTFDCSVSHHEPKQFYCEEWTPQDRW